MRKWRVLAKQVTYFDEKNFEELIVGFIGETREKKFSKENSDESLAIGKVYHHQTYTS